MWLLWSSLVFAGDLVVQVDGPDPAHPGIACRLYDTTSAAVFPGGAAEHETRSTLDARGQPVCRFRDLLPGRYAVAAILDRNGNDALDTTTLGVPTEPWGVTNNARPTFRAPTFDEAAVVVPGNGRVDTRLTLKD